MSFPPSALGRKFSFPKSLTISVSILSGSIIFTLIYRIIHQERQFLQFFSDFYIIRVETFSPSVIIIRIPKLKREDVAVMALTSASLPAKKQILSVCVKLFLEQGYKKTTVADIVRLAGVSNSSFQNIFRAKDGVLTELVQFMYERQFAIAQNAATAALPPMYVYAIETSVQMALTELNENLREIYVEAYTHEEALSYIQHSTAQKLYEIFGRFQPELSEEDFFYLDLGTSGLMRGYMVHPCSEEFPLEEKLKRFLTSSLRVLKVPEQDVQQVVSFVLGLNIRGLSLQVMEGLFKALAMHYEFSLSGILPSAAE